MNAPDQPESLLLERAAGIRPSDELREAVLAEILHDQLQVVRAVQDVAALVADSDRRLVATVQSMREENAKLTGLVGRSEDAFKGELALRAAEHARAEFVKATAGVLDRLQTGLAAVEREAAVSRMRRIVDGLAVAFGTSVLTLAGMWALLHR